MSSVCRVDTTRITGFHRGLVTGKGRAIQTPLMPAPKVAWKAEKLDATHHSTTEFELKYRHKEDVFGYPNKYMSKKEGREERMEVPREVTTKIETVGAKYEARVSKAPLPTVWAKFGDGRKPPPLC